jgi:hypothetical protein
VVFLCFIGIFFICLFALQSMVKCNYSASTESTREAKEDRLVVRNDYDKKWGNS